MGCWNLLLLIIKILLVQGRSRYLEPESTYDCDQMYVEAILSKGSFQLLIRRKWNCLGVYLESLGPRSVSRHGGLNRVRTRSCLAVAACRRNARRESPLQRSLKDETAHLAEVVKVTVCVGSLEHIKSLLWRLVGNIRKVEDSVVLAFNRLMAFLLAVLADLGWLLWALSCWMTFLAADTAGSCENTGVGAFGFGMSKQSLLSAHAQLNRSFWPTLPVHS